MKELIPALLLLAILTSPPLIGHLIERRKQRKQAAPKSRKQSEPGRKLTVLG